MGAAFLPENESPEDAVEENAKGKTDRESESESREEEQSRTFVRVDLAEDVTVVVVFLVAARVKGGAFACEGWKIRKLDVDESMRAVGRIRRCGPLDMGGDCRACGSDRFVIFGPGDLLGSDFD